THTVTKVTRKNDPDDDGAVTTIYHKDEAKAALEKKYPPTGKIWHKIPECEGACYCVEADQEPGGWSKKWSPTTIETDFEDAGTTYPGGGTAEQKSRVIYRNCEPLRWVASLFSEPEPAGSVTAVAIAQNPEILELVNLVADAQRRLKVLVSNPLLN